MWGVFELPKRPEFPVVIATLGGKGTRLYPLTLIQSKALIPIVNYPLFMRMLEVLANQGARKFIFSTKGINNTLYLKDVFRYAAGFSARLHLAKRVHFMYQPNYRDTGSADAVKYNMEYYGINNDVLVVSGDNIASIDLKKLISFHRRNDAVATVVVKKLGSDGDLSQFGVAKLDKDDRITRFVEKPKKGEIESRLINTAIYLFSSKIRDVLKAMGDDARDIGRDLMPYLIEKGYPVYGYRWPGYWADAGTPDSFLKTSLDMLNLKVEHISFRKEHEYRKGVWVHPTTVFRFKKKGPKLLKSTMIGGDCSIDSSAFIENSSIGDNCSINGGVNIRNSVVMDFVNIGRDVTLNGCIVGRYVTIGDGSSVNADNEVQVAGNKEKTPVIGDGVYIEENSVLGSYKRVAQISDAYKILKTDKFVDLGYDSHNIYFIEK